MFNYFTNIENEEQAYYLGLLFAIGSLKKDRFIIKISNKYKDLMINLSYSLYQENRVKFKDKYLSLNLEKEITNQLILHGRNSNTFPCLSSHLIPHFMRGHLDGTGSIVISKLGERLDGKVMIRLAPIFKETYCNYLYEHKIQYVSTSTGITIAGNIRINHFYHYLYDSATIYASWNINKFTQIIDNSIKFNPSLRGTIQLNDSETKDIIDLYLNGETTVSIGEKFKVSYNFIRKILKNNNITIRDQEECNRKIPINKHYFDQIDSEDKAYYLGFLFADGCNYNNKIYQISLGLHKKDIQILKNYSNLIYNQEHLTQYKNMVICSIYSKHMSKVLESYGCTPRKSLTLKFPTCVPDNLLHHFMRGYFDGDGCIYLHRRDNKISAKINIVSTMDFCQQYKQILLQKTGLESYIYHDKRDLARGNHITSILTMGGNIKISKLYQYFYADSHYHLQRKHDKFLEVKDQLLTNS